MRCPHLPRANGAGRVGGPGAQKPERMESGRSIDSLCRGPSSFTNLVRKVRRAGRDKRRSKGVRIRRGSCCSFHQSSICKHAPPRTTDSPRQSADCCLSRCTLAIRQGSIKGSASLMDITLRQPGGFLVSFHAAIAASCANFTLSMHLHQSSPP